MKNSSERLQTLRNIQKESTSWHQPFFYRLNNSEKKQKFSELLSVSGITVVDYISEQIGELLKFRSPESKFSTEELELKTKTHLGELNKDEYGVWVHYPWSNRLVHLLDEEEFIEVRTSRNQYKITPQERDVLAKKKIGVIGLSVGQSVSVTLAMERICGELRLADFDILELTNLNRIRTGVHNLGLPKVYSVAREIAEIDPFLKVVCFPDGLHEENMDQFFTKGGNLDLLVEESDGFDIKILSRLKARSLRIPVIMEGSDRCLVDVERFDLEPERSILHGFVDHLDVNMLKTLKTNEEKIPYMLAILGLDTSSLRLKASMLEIEQTINTWPQLASAVTMGGGITADVCRRMLLNQYTESGRYHIDIEELICNKKSVKKEVASAPVKLPSSLQEFAKRVEIPSQTGQLILSQAEVTRIVEAACKAPSGGNSQPWRWVYKNGALYVFNAFHNGPGFLAFGNFASYVAIGAAAENTILMARELGYDATYTTFPDAAADDLIMSFKFFKQHEKKNNPLVKAIDTRLTNRKLGKRQAIEPQLLALMTKAVSDIPGAGIRFFTSEQELDNIADLLGELEKIRLLEKSGHRDFVAEVRWTVEENDEKRDGVDLRTLELTPSEKVGLEVAKDEKIIELINQWQGGGAFKKLTKKSIQSAGAVGIITMKQGSKEDFLYGGMALERVWLTANANDIAFQPTSASVFVYARLIQGKGEGLSAQAVSKLTALRPRFESTFLVEDNCREIFIFRLSKNTEPEIKSLRKPLKELFTYL
ncbi:MAG: Rv1355c family protein [bacterium]|nr:Rv1355c family protein [bacterium]